LNDIDKLDPSVTIVDLAANQNVFSQRLGTRHQSLLGTRILLEYDPVSGYEEVVKEFAGEFVSNVEPVVVFTNLGSPVYKQLQQRQNIRLFVFSSKISTPSRATEGQVLLPDRDTSLLIDAVDKVVQALRSTRSLQSSTQPTDKSEARINDETTPSWSPVS